MAGPVPRWIVLLGSAAIAFHLIAVVSQALAAPSGPWPSLEGPDEASAPQFAFSLNSMTESYLKLVKMTHNYHFPSNRPMAPAVSLEVRLLDENGQEIETVRVPDDTANPWVRHRESVLARWLGEDRPIAPPQSEVIAGPGRDVPEVLIWELAKGRESKDHKVELTVRKVDVNSIPRDRPVFGPSAASLLLARSYARYLCRTHGAARVEILRHHKDPIPPVVMFMENVQAGGFEEQVSNFGELQP
jgi:hypothetical protein